MARNYKKEAEWRKKNYEFYSLKLKKEEAKKFNDLLKKDNIGFTAWAKQRINKYIEESEKK